MLIAEEKVLLHTKKKQFTKNPNWCDFNVILSLPVNLIIIFFQFFAAVLTIAATLQAMLMVGK